MPMSWSKLSCRFLYVRWWELPLNTLLLLPYLQVGVTVGVVDLGCGERQWHWDPSLLDFEIFEIGLRIRMGCGCEGQICLTGNL